MNKNNFITSMFFQLLPKKYFCTANEFQKSIQVCILGAHSTLGRLTSLLMKQNPIISSLKLHGECLMQNLVADLNQMDTPCKVQGFEACADIGKALRGADVIIMLGCEHLKEDTLMVDRILAESRRVYDLTHEFINYSPRAILIVNVSPISVMTPFVANILKKTNWYNPGRIIGSTALAQMKINTVFGRYQHLDPQMCQVPILGGPDVDVAVPLFSKAKPLELNDPTAEPMMAIFRGLSPSDFPKKTYREDFVEKCPSGEAFALNTMINTIGMGLCGDKDAYYSGFVRSNLINTCQHLATMLQFSRGGVVHNTGIPQLSKLEFQMLEKVLLQIKEREEMAEQLLEFIESGSCAPPLFKQKDMEKRKLLQQTVIQG